MGITGKPNFERTIRDMRVGEVGYSVPWALDFDKTGGIYLNLDMSIKKSPEGTCTLQIKKTDEGRTDYDVNLNIGYFGGKYEWKISEIPFSNLIGGNRLKIAKISPDRDQNLNKGLENIVHNQKSSISFPKDPNEQKYPLTWRLRKELTRAISTEDYERAAVLRDKINATKEQL